MKRWLAIAVLALCLPLGAWANSTSLVFNNQGGRITSSGNTLALSNSTLSGFIGFDGVPVIGNLGTVSFTTGPLATGSLGTGGTFAPGGTFTITGNGSNGLPTGILFQGVFSGPVSWLPLFNQDGFGFKGNFTYGLAGNLSGLLANGANGFGGTVQLTFDVPQGALFSNRVRLNQGVTLVTAPEPGTLGLLGTGLFALAGLVRRKFSK